MLDSLLFFLPFLLVLEWLPNTILQLFNASGTMLEIGTPALRLMALAWLISIPGLVVSAALQGLSLARPSMVLTVLRQAILPVLLVFVLGKTGQMISVWAAFLAAEAICIPLAGKQWNRNYTSMISEDRFQLLCCFFHIHSVHTRNCHVKAHNKKHNRNVILESSLH